MGNDFPTPSVFTSTRWNSWKPRRSFWARSPRTVCAGMVAEEPVVIRGGHHSTEFGRNERSASTLERMPAHPRAQRRPAPCASPLVARRVAHMARGERRRSLTVVGGARGEVARYASLLPATGGPVLVLGVADGRLAEALVRRDVPVTGVDPSPRMLARAEETRARLPPELQGRMQLLRADLRSLRLSQRFAAVFAPRDAVALVATRSDLEALFLTARAPPARARASPSICRSRPRAGCSPMTSTRTRVSSRSGRCSPRTSAAAARRAGPRRAAPSSAPPLHRAGGGPRARRRRARAAHPRPGLRGPRVGARRRPDGGGGAGAPRASG